MQKFKPTTYILGLFILLLSSCSDDSNDVISGAGIFITPSGNAAIEGELFLPEGDGPFPVIVIVPGSGNEPRNDLEQFVDIIIPNGYGVYIYDKRGIGGSTGNYPTETLENPFDFLNARADDIIGIIDLLKKHADINNSGIALMGSSQGTWVNCIVYSKRGEDVSSMIMASGGAASTRVEGYYEEILANSNVTVEQANEMLKDYVGDLGYDPVPTLRNTEVPTLFVLGGKDDSHPTHYDAEIIIGMNKSNFTIHFYPNANHELVDVDTNQIPGNLFSDLGEWLVENN